MLRGKVIISSLIVLFVAVVAYPVVKKQMFVLWPNSILWVCVALVGGTIGFVIYGLFKGFENTFPDD